MEGGKGEENQTFIIFFPVVDWLPADQKQMGNCRRSEIIFQEFDLKNDSAQERGEAAHLLD